MIIIIYNYYNYYNHNYNNRCFDRVTASFTKLISLWLLKRTMGLYKSGTVKKPSEPSPSCTALTHPHLLELLTHSLYPSNVHLKNIIIYTR